MEKKNKQEIKQPVPAGQAGKKDDCKCNKECGCCERKNEHKHAVPAKTVTVVSALLLSISVAFGQGQSSFWSDPINNPMFPLYITVAFVALTILLLIVVIVYVLKVFNIIIQQTEQERAAKLGLPVTKQMSWWEKFWLKINALAPIEKEHDLDTGHDFDGIRELDNHLPPWWTGLFYATIVWAAVYLVLYHVTDSFPLSGGEYQNELAEAERSARALQASRPAEQIDANSLQYKADEDIITRGRAVFISSTCASCHRNDGGGNTIGPNLADEYWLHGGSIRDIYSTINKGVVEKGMPAWGKTMTPKDVRDVAFFVMSLRGSKPANGKTPQGELYKEEPAAPTDSTNVQAMSH